MTAAARAAHLLAADVATARDVNKPKWVNRVGPGTKNVNSTEKNNIKIVQPGKNGLITQHARARRTKVKH